MSTQRLLNSPEEFADGIVVERAIRDAAVTADKIGTGAVTRAKITKGFLVNWVSPPVTPGSPMTSNATGTAGDCCYVAPYLYVCVATNTWVRKQMDLSW